MLGGKSDGRTDEMSVLTEADDLCAVLDHVRRLPYVDRSKVSLMGCNQGGLVSALVAVKRPSEAAPSCVTLPRCSVGVECTNSIPAATPPRRASRDFRLDSGLRTSCAAHPPERIHSGTPCDIEPGTLSLSVPSSSAAQHPYSKPDQSRKARGLKAPLNRRQLIRDLDMLGALLKADATSDAIAGEMGITHHGSRYCDVLLHTLVPTMGKGSVVSGEAHGDIHPFRAWKTIPAARARDLIALRDLLAGDLHSHGFGILKRARKRRLSCIDVLQQLLLRVHP